MKQTFDIENLALDELAARKVTSNELINGVLDYIHIHFSESITLEVLSEQFFYSPSYLCRLFKSEVGCNFAAYLRRVRMEYAIHLLKNENIPVPEVALKCGYSVQAFYPIFKSYTGVTPAVYLKNNCAKRDPAITNL